MQPIEFIMEMSGISKVLGPDEPPTLAQWQKIHAMLAETMAPLVARKLFELGEEYEKQQKQKMDVMQEMMKNASKYDTLPAQQGLFGAPGVTYTARLYTGTGTTK